jgi:FkbM family methyltransferase
MCDEEYKKLSQFTEALYVIDAGANVGFTSLYLAKRLPFATIIALEPDPENYKMLVRNVRATDRIIPVQGALWSHSTSLSMSDQQFGDGDFWAKTVAEIPGCVRAFSVADIIQAYSMRGMILVKIDIEGAETIVFSKNVELWMPEVTAVNVEIHFNSQFGNPSELIESVVAAYSMELVKTGEGILFYKSGAERSLTD